MNKNAMTFLEKFSNTPSFSGREHLAQKMWLDYVKPFTDKVDTDIVGNVWGTLNPGSSLKVGVFGHCDEIGLMVTYIDEQGYVYVRHIGDHHPRAIPGSFVNIYNSRGVVNGIFGIVASHILENDKRNKIPKLKEMWIDLGTKNRKESEKLVSVGDFATIRNPFQILRNKRIIGTGLDNKLGSFVVAEVLRKLQKKKLDVTLHAVSAVHEELTSGGAATSTFDLDIDVAIVVDLAFSTDHPEIDKRLWGDIKLGSGPVLPYASILNQKVSEGIHKAADRLKIKVQKYAEGGATGTDSDFIYMTRKGVATGMLTIPSRYMHTPCEMVDISDIDNCIDIIAEYVSSLKSGENFYPVKL